jgi:hypothetical protein
MVYVIEVFTQLSSRTRMDLRSVLVLLESWNSTCITQFLYPSSGVHSLYAAIVYVIPLLSVQWMNSWWWTKELSDTWRVSRQNKFVKSVHLVGFIIKEICHDAQSHERKKKYKSNIEARSWNHCCCGKAISITHCECVSVALGTQQAKRMRCIILSYCLSGSTNISLHYFINGKTSGEKNNSKFYLR